MALEHLVGDLFLLARADSGSLSLGNESLDVAELIDEAVEAVEPVAMIKRVRVTAELTGPIPILGDDQALGRVLRNLLDNAIRHSPDDGVVTVADLTEAGDDVAIVGVFDEGEGFPESFVPQAFERFTQADDARSSQGGAGLGLAIAKTLLDAHDGAIEIVPGDGGQVMIGLPVQRHTRPKVADPTSDASDRAARRPSRAGSRSRRRAGTRR